MAILSSYLRISGMSCASCVGRIEKALLSVPSVREAQVNLATEEARVIWRGPEASPSLLIAAVQSAGFSAVLKDPSDAPHPAEPSDRHWLYASILTLPLLFPMLLDPFGINLQLPGWAQLILLLPLQFGLGARFYKGTWKALRQGAASMDVLIVLGTSAALVLSLVHLRQGGPYYFETSAVIITLVLIGKKLESTAKNQAVKALRALDALLPEKVWRQLGTQREEVPLSELAPGDVVAVLPGGKVPCDGMVLEGSSQLDESLLSGESLPVYRTKGDSVPAGAINGDGLLLVEVVALGGETSLGRLSSMVSASMLEKPPLQQWVDKLSAFFVPMVVVLALATFVITFALGYGWDESSLRALAVLVIACPCAMGLATPAALMVGTGVAARAGIVVADTGAFERLHRVKTLVFDKTGTLTTGHASLAEIYMPTESQISSDQLVAIAAAVQLGSEHPLARAVIAYAKKLQLAPLSTQSIEALPGRGVMALVDGRRVLVGSERLMQEWQISTEILAPAIAKSRDLGQALAFVAETERRQLFGCLSFTDPLRPTAAALVKALQGEGLHLLMLSGDHKAAVQNVSEQLGGLPYEAELLPEEKLAVIQRLQRTDPPTLVAMVGDGLNDAPALARADVGIALASGTDVARKSAGLTLMRQDPWSILDAWDLSARLSQKIKQNLAWAFLYNALALPLAAMGYLHPMLASGAMALSSSSVILNALLLRRWRPVMRS